MAKKKKDKPAPSKEKQNFLGAAGRNMKYKDLKRKAVILGMPFPDACAAGVFDLIKYISNSTNKPDKSLILRPFIYHVHTNILIITDTILPSITETETNF